jgi:hypothetical protein
LHGPSRSDAKRRRHGGGEKLHLSGEVGRAGAAGKDKAVVGNVEACSNQPAGERAVDRVDVELGRPAAGQARSKRPFQTGTRRIHHQASVPEAYLHQHLLLAGAARTDGEADAVGEADVGCADLGELAPLGNGARCAETLVWPDHPLARNGGSDGDLLRGGV